MKRFMLLCSMLALLLCVTILSSHTVSAATSASLHPNSCSPGQYVRFDTAGIYDKGSGTLIGTVSIYRDGCGWVYADASSGYNQSYINHLELWDNNTNQRLYAVPYNGKSYNRTIHISTHGDCVYAVGIVQVPWANYWGTGVTYCTTGY